MSILLCLSDTELLEAVCCKVLTQCVLDLFLLECNELVGNELVVILEAYICERHEAVSSLKVLDALCIRSITGLSCDIFVRIAESLCDLSCTVRTEVEEDNGVVRLNDRNGLALIIYDNRRKNELVCYAAVGRSLHSSNGICSLNALAQYE